MGCQFSIVVGDDILLTRIGNYHFLDHVMKIFLMIFYRRRQIFSATFESFVGVC